MKEYTEKDMIKFGVHVQKKKNYQYDLDIEWELTEYLGGESIKKLNLPVVSGSALADAYHGGWRRSKKYAKENNFHGLNRKEIKKYFDKWYEEHYR